MTSDPFTGSQNVALDYPVTFTFLTPMAPKQLITWSANVQSVQFTYTWSADGTKLTCTHTDKFPANAVITWTLEPSGFSDQSGTPLMEVNNTGSFSTGSDQTNNNPCSGSSTNRGEGALSLFKSVRYVQTSASAPVLDSDGDPAMFAVTLASPKTNPVTQASVKLPNGSTMALTNFFGQFMAFDNFPTEQAMEAAYPGGSYVVTMQRESGTAVLTLDLPINGAPPTPQVANFPQTQAFDPTADFTLQWLPFTGVTTTDGISVDMDDGAGTSFHAPDVCIPIPLPNTATSITIPANTFGMSADMQGWITFMRMSALDTNSVPGINAAGFYSKMTRFKLQDVGTVPATTPPQLLDLVREQNGTVSFQVKAAAGATLNVQGSTDLKTWTPVMTAPAAAGVLHVSDSQAATLPYRFYRATVQEP